MQTVLRGARRGEASGIAHRLKQVSYTNVCGADCGEEEATRLLLEADAWLRPAQGGVFSML